MKIPNFTVLFILFFLCAFQPYLHCDLRHDLGRRLLVHFRGEEVNDDARRLIQQEHVGGFLFFSWANGLQSKEQVTRLCRDLQALTPEPLIFAVDQEGGRVVHLRGEFTAPPPASHLLLEEVASYASQVGREMKEVGMTLNLAPVLDIVVDPAVSPLASRSYGPDPQRVIVCGRAVLQGLRQQGVEGCVKHFPGLGSVVEDTHYVLPTITKSLLALEQEDLLPFIALLDETRYLMVGHVNVLALDPDHVASLSKAVLTDYLRGELGYKGMILSDSLIMQGVIEEAGSVEEAVLLALKAGCDYAILAGKMGGAEEITPADVSRILDYLIEHWKAS